MCQLEQSGAVLDEMQAKSELCLYFLNLLSHIFSFTHTAMNYLW